MVRQKFILNPSVKIIDEQQSIIGCTWLRDFIKRLLTRKSITQLQNEADQGNELKRTLSSFQLLALGIGSIIGM